MNIILESKVYSVIKAYNKATSKNETFSEINKGTVLQVLQEYDLEEKTVIKEMKKKFESDPELKTEDKQQFFYSWYLEKKMERRKKFYKELAPVVSKTKRWEVVLTKSRGGIEFINYFDKDKTQVNGTIYITSASKSELAREMHVAEQARNCYEDDDLKSVLFNWLYPEKKAFYQEEAKKREVIFNTLSRDLETYLPPEWSPWNLEIKNNSLRFFAKSGKYSFSTFKTDAEGIKKDLDTAARIWLANCRLHDDMDEVFEETKTVLELCEELQRAIKNM
jgi:hypothetical protein